MREKKGTKVSWIGEIPLEWELKKIKRVFKTTNGYGFPDKLQGQQAGDIPFLKVSDFPKNSDFILSSSNYVSLDTLNKKNWKTTEPMSIITAKIGEAMKKNHRKISVEPCLIDNNMMSLSVKKGHLKYFFYASKIIDFSWFANPGAVPSLNHRQFRESYIMSPPIAEQQTIANFLNKKTSEIDALISDKEKLIALLEEKRQAIITEAVTKGLDPGVKMKDSGVEWIGEIPEHWEVEKYKNLIQRVKRPPKLHAEIITAFRDGIVTLRKNRREDGYTFAIKEHGYQQIKEGDLVVHQMDAFAGAIGISDSEGKASPVYTVCTPLDKNIHTPYLSWSLKVMSMGGYIQALAKGIRERSTDFRWNDMKGLLTCLPPYKEQVEIERYIETFIKENTDLITKSKDAIKLLKEYRQALIYEAVTGKIDVQEMLKETDQEEVSSS